MHVRLTTTTKKMSNGSLQKLGQNIKTENLVIYLPTTHDFKVIYFRDNLFKAVILRVTLNSTKVWSNMIKIDISANLYQKCLNYESTRCVPQYKLDSFATMATDWVPDFSDIKDNQTIVLIFGNYASSAWPSKHMNMSVVLMLCENH